ncbi:MAG: hypothetical protein HOF43_07870, partial [Chloroflexi bacterium]|nr:hypothetical protein [Chloroflexota bacterium]
SVISTWSIERSALDAPLTLQSAGVSAAPSPDSTAMYADPHLQERGFYALIDDMDGQKRGLPGLPWRWLYGERLDVSAAPGLGADTDSVLADVLGLSDEQITTLRESGALT